MGANSLYMKCVYYYNNLPENWHHITNGEQDGEHTGQPQSGVQPVGQHVRLQRLEARSCRRIAAAGAGASAGTVAIVSVGHCFGSLTVALQARQVKTITVS